eukprot:4672824-Alexandrium_andersonii.AAC.1
MPVALSTRCYVAAVLSDRHAHKCTHNFYKGKWDTPRRTTPYLTRTPRHAPPLKLLPNPGNDAGHLLREDVNHQLLPQLGPPTFARPRMLFLEDA